MTPQPSSFLPIVLQPQIVPAEDCAQCDVCCRFPEADSFLRPYFSDQEIRGALDQGIDPAHFSGTDGCQIDLVPDPTGEGFLCPAFDPQTHQCRIYPVRPLDCQLYPFALMWNETQETVLFAWDPKCPHLLGLSGEKEPPLWSNKSPSSLSLPLSVLEQADAMVSQLESAEGIASIRAHPGLITVFQADVVILKSLTHLTAALQLPA